MINIPIWTIDHIKEIVLLRTNPVFYLISFSPTASAVVVAVAVAEDEGSSDWDPRVFN